MIVCLLRQRFEINYIQTKFYHIRRNQSTPKCGSPVLTHIVRNIGHIQPVQPVHNIWELQSIPGHSNFLNIKQQEHLQKF